MPNSTAPSRAVAVVGMACRVPGASSPNELWTLLCKEIDATSDTPAERYDVDEFHSSCSTPGKMVARRAGYIDDISGFDTDFFGMSAAEATDLDPQQRLLLMTTWEALENAGQHPDRLAGTRTGVFVGNIRADYMENLYQRGLDSVTAAQFFNMRAAIPGRLAHFFDFRGPSVLLDTACSSSLVAVHQAIQSIRAGEVPFAIAAGANIPLRPNDGVMMSQLGTMSSDGRSKFGDEAADGHAPSDAVGVVALKPLEAALADGDPIRAVIAGTAVGSDGRTSDSVANPSLDGQLETLDWAYSDAGIDPSEVAYVEAHGSGSPQFDPIELEALGRYMGAGREPGRRLLTGSVKSNVGHAEAATSIIGLIKTVLCLEHGQVPASIHVETPRTDIDWDGWGLEIPTSLRDLSGGDDPVVAGVSAQGISALNAHLVLIQGERQQPTAVVERSREPYLLALSAATSESLEALKHSYASFLATEGTQYPIRDICHTAATRRQHLPYRTVVSGKTHQDLVDALTNGAKRISPRKLSKVAASYLSGEDIDWDAVFQERPGNFVPLPTYPWHLKRYWHDEVTHTETDPTTGFLNRHARTAFDDKSILAEVGIDSLAKLKLIVELQQESGQEVDPGELDALRTVGELRQWANHL